MDSNKFKIVEGVLKKCNISPEDTELIIPNNVWKIERLAIDLYDTNIKRIKIPSSVTSITKYAIAGLSLDEDSKIVEYNGTLIKSGFIYGYEVNGREKKYINYGLENLPRLEKMIKIINPSNIPGVSEAFFENMPQEVFDIIPLDDSLKSYQHSYPRFKEVLNLLDNKDIGNIFKLSYILGLFTNQDDKELTRKIAKFYIKNPEIKYSEIELEGKNNKKLAELLFKLDENNNVTYNNKNILTRVITEFNSIKKFSLDYHEHKIGLLNAEMKKRETEEEKRKLENIITILRQHKKEIFYDDVCYYLECNNFIIPDECNALVPYMQDFFTYSSAKGTFEYVEDAFDKLLDLYKKSLGRYKNVPYFCDNEKEGFTYELLAADDPRNILIGYLVDCCTKIGGEGEENLVQSIINPNVFNIIIKVGDKVVGKTTGFYNPEEKYILFNNFEGVVFNYDNESKIDIIKAICRATNDMLDAFKNQNIEIKSVRMGNFDNKLDDKFKEYFYLDTNNLLENNKSYSADCAKVGQYILSNGQKIELSNFDVKNVAIKN